LKVFPNYAALTATFPSFVVKAFQNTQ